MSVPAPQARVKLRTSGAIHLDGKAVGLWQRLSIGGYEFMVRGQRSIAHYKADIPAAVVAIAATQATNA
jgi:hypothetical protein